jgi:hypothetical protein
MGRLLVACLFLGYVSRALGGECAFPFPPKTLVAVGAADKAGSKLIQTWELPDSAALWSNRLPESASLLEYRATLQRLVSDLSPAALLRRALPVIPSQKPDDLNLQIALGKASRWIRPMQCLEALLLGRQTDRMDMVKSPSELIAFVLRSRTKAALKIFTYTENEPGIYKLGEILGYVEKELASEPDWQLWINLHNHNFKLGQPNILGVTAPSAADVGAFRDMANDLGLQEARITNGFDTIELKRADFWEFKAAEPS